MFIILLLLSIFRISNSQICSLNSSPTSISDCNTSLNTSNYCCFTELTFNETISHMCVLFPKNVAFILPHLKLMNLSNDDPPIDIDIDCGDIDYKNNTCGLPNPETIDDCKQYSNSTHPCCLFQSPQSSVCFYNDIKTQSIERMFGYTIQCKSVFFEVKYIFIILFLFILI